MQTQTQTQTFAALWTQTTGFKASPALLAELLAKYPGSTEADWCRAYAAAWIEKPQTFEGRMAAETIAAVEDEMDRAYGL
jgi:hypothetical protein